MSTGRGLLPAHPHLPTQHGISRCLPDAQQHRTPLLLLLRCAHSPHVHRNALVGVVQQRPGLHLVEGALRKVVGGEALRHPLPPLQRQLGLVVVAAEGRPRGRGRRRFDDKKVQGKCERAALPQTD